MKKLFLFTVMVIFPTLVLGQTGEYYYWYKGEKQYLEFKPDKQFLLLSENPDLNTLSQILQIGTDKIEPPKKVALGALSGRYSKHKKDENLYWTTTELNRSLPSAAYELVVYQAPFFYAPNGRELGMSHLFYVKLNSQNDIESLETLAETNEVEIVGNNRYMPLWYILACDKNSAGNALEMANKFYESGLFPAVEPDFMEDVTYSVNDPFFDDQWNLHNTGQYGGSSGSDIQILDAWDITKSHTDIILAVLDHGIEMGHPDLPNIHTDSYDTESGTSPSLVLGPHGTAVSGIAGADVDNSEGIAGIAPYGQLMSISNSLAGTPNSRMKRADGINFAWHHGAHIVNNSWGSGVQYQVIDEAIDSAVTYGRGGLGTVVIFASGNGNSSSIGYPSTDPNVVAVGATSMCDERKSPSSCDGENWWGSNYGSGLDVVAPGVKIYTTDRQGTAGYNTSSGTAGNYFAGFNGTSSAAPHVAGIASLILSINNDLSVEEARDAIESTTEKVGGYSYTMGAGERQDLTWNNQMGYGRVNAYQALIYTIENHGAHLGTEISQVRLPLYDDLPLQEDVSLEAGSSLTIESESGIVTIAAASGTVTIGGPGGASKIVGGTNSGDDGSDDGTGETEDPQTSPEQFTLSNNYPNPFNPTTVISYQLPVTSHVTLKVFDMLGREVASLVNGRVSAGQYEVQFDASNLSSGLYIYRLQAGEFIQTKKMLLIK